MDDDGLPRWSSHTPITVRVGDQLLVGTVQKFHLPGQHDQRSHGNRVGKKTLIPTKTGLGRYAHLQRKGTGTAHVGDVVELHGSGLESTIKYKQGTVTRWINDNRAEIELTDGTVTDVHKDFIKVVRTGEEVAADRKSGHDPAGNAKKILTGYYGDRLHIVGKETERTRANLNALAKAPHSHHERVSKYLNGKDTGGIYIGHGPVTDLSPGMAAMKDVKPRGWREGSTWSQVGGSYSPYDRELTVGVADSGSHSTAAHEFGHALEDTLTREHYKGWKDIYKKLDSSIMTSPYFHPLRNPGHVDEAFAELYSVWATGGNVKEGVRAIGNPRSLTEAGHKAALDAVLEAFNYFADIKAEG